MEFIMKKIVLATKRRWNWKVFLVLVGLNIPAVFAILPYSLKLQNASFSWEVLILDRLINILPIVLLGAIGLVLSNRIGLGLPFTEMWAKGDPFLYKFRKVTAIACIIAVVLVLMSIFLHTLVIDPPLNAMLEKMGIANPAEANSSPFYGFLAAISAGISEETLYRLFGLSLLAWLGGLLFHDSDGRPKLIVFWSSNVVFALGFGLAHLPSEAVMGIPLNPLVVASTLVLNGIGGLAFGWLFWTFGLESAMLAHILADIIQHAMIPFVTMQNGETARYLAASGMVVLVLLALVWACRTLFAKERRQATAVH
jgi:hypothetical protein